MGRTPALKGTSMLNLHKLQVQQGANELFALVGELPQPPVGHQALGEQLRRAATEVRSSIARAATQPDSPQHYAAARGSAVQCAAHIDCYRFLRVIEPRQYAAAMRLLSPLVASLTKLAR